MDNKKIDWTRSHDITVEEVPKCIKAKGVEPIGEMWNFLVEDLVKIIEFIEMVEL